MTQKSGQNPAVPICSLIEAIEPWDLSKTCTLVGRAFGPEQRELVQPCLRSIADRQNFARYHYSETDRLLKAFQRKHLVKQHLMLAIHGGNESARIAFESLMVKAGAHVTAGIQAIHAIPDILASGVYLALGLNRSQDALADRQVNLTSVTNHIKRKPEFIDLSNLLKEVSEGDSYEHLSALSNLSKHRSVIRHSLSQDMTGKREQLLEFQIKSFEKHTAGGTKHYPSISVVELLSPEFSRVGELVIRIGHKIDDLLELALRNR